MEEREDHLLTVTELSAYFRVGPESIRRWLRTGKLRGINLGRGAGWRVRRGGLEAFISDHHSKVRESPPGMSEKD